MSAALDLDARLRLHLTFAELVEVTGYRRASQQAAYIRRHYGCPAHVNAAGECVVIRAHLEAAREPEHNRPPIRQVRKRA